MVRRGFAVLLFSGGNRVGIITESFRVNTRGRSNVFHLFSISQNCSIYRSIMACKNIVRYFGFR
ncbi:unnamed protein product [Moneuplotes crassus]|uniref:Uncharacterized protein n=1 Tax=Euplotes crassus TaxID=5936 RepID=A0AAD1XGZ6_EUPCR|nr:unnamed protein product [Moneuplotes crassus]